MQIVMRGEAKNVANQKTDFSYVSVIVKEKLIDHPGSMFGSCNRQRVVHSLVYQYNRMSNVGFPISVSKLRWFGG